MKFSEPAPEQLRTLLKSMVGRKVAVIGDAMLDTYLMGRVDRISPEAPVPVFHVQEEERVLGGAANVAKALVALGAKVRLCALVGKDAESDIFLNEAKGLGIGVQGVVRDGMRPTTTKIRLVAKQQQMMRMDREDRQSLSARLETRLIGQVRKAAKWADAIVLSDYAKGVLTAAVSREAIASGRRKPIVVDPKELPWARYRGATVIKPNRPETEACTGINPREDADAEKAARRVLKEVGANYALITRGSQGMTLGWQTKAGRKGKRTELLHLSSRPREVFDVTGAGDVVAGVVALALAAGADMATATWLANVAAGVKVGKFGPATVSDQEILEAVGGGEALTDHKVKTGAQAARLAERLRKQGKTVVFTNGCFDILHYGHVNYLERSRKLGDALIVGINSDASVRRLKGPGRPVQHEHDRARILAAQACVDAVVLFDEDTPRDLIAQVKPEVLCKGADYKHKKDVVGWDLVEGWGGRVVLVELVEGRSTSKLIQQTRK